MTEFVVESVLHNLNSLIQKQSKPFVSFNQDLRRLAVMFTTIKPLLEDAEEKQFSHTVISNWMQKINDAANMVDDIIDECDYEALRSEYRGVKGSLSDKVQCSCLSSFQPKHIVFGYKIAKKMKRISKKLVEILEEVEKFHLIGTDRIAIGGRRVEVIEGPRTTSFCEPRVYGRERHTNMYLIDLTSNHDEFMDVLSIYRIEGPKGFGKTTFAKLIFNHPMVVDHFELRIWVCRFIDFNFNFERIIEAILEAAIGCDCEDLDLDTVQKKLQNLLHGKRYLIVLDFDWHRNSLDVDWQRLKSVLACGKKGASILVTAPASATIAKLWDGYVQYKLSVLSDEDSWKLFKQQVFEPNEEIPFELEAIGKEIVQKCRGVPLAAKLIGGLLHSTREGKNWLNVNRSNIWNLLEVEGPVKCAMILSYLNLPISLKKCFASCAIFSKVDTIRKPYLIELWMANGFISSHGRLDAEDAGDDVWNEFYKRSFFQDIETDEFGNITSFRMHNRVMKLAKLVAQDVNYLIDGNIFIHWSKRTHHLSDYRRRIGLNSIDLQQIKSLRTYLIPNQYSDQISPNVLKCHSLRVLELRLRGELSPSIGDLKHLRYLNLSKSDFKTLPEFLCKLWNLQILKLDYCKYLKKLPDGLIDLRCLEKLSFKGSPKLSSLPPQMGELTSLRSLTSYFVGNERGFLLGELGGMKLKGDLEMKHLERVKSVEDAMEANMSRKRLKELRLSWDRNEETKLGEDVEEILEVLRPDNQQLVSLTVTGYPGGRFPRWMFSGSLKKLEIERCRELKGLQEGLESMTALQSLRLYDLPNLESLPDCFQQLSSLRRLAIGFCCKLMSLPNSLRDKRLERLDIYACPALEDLLCDCSTSLSVCQLRVDGRLILNKVKEGLYPCQI